MRNSRGQFVSVTRTVLRPSNRGRNSRQLALHRATKGAKRAKKQVLPTEPRPVTAYRMRFDRA